MALMPAAACGEGRPAERGVALVAVVLLLMLMSGLAAALTVGATTDTLMARNHQVTAQARAAADAGLAHAVAATLTQLRGWSASGFATPGASITALLRGPDGAVGTAWADADNGSLEPAGLARAPGRVALAGEAAATYEVRVLDDDDPRLGRSLSATDLARIGEDGEAASDANSLLVVRAIGYAGTTALPGAGGIGGNAFAAGAALASGAVAVAEASIGLRPLPAVVANGPLTVRDAALIGGAEGSVHANGNLDLTGAPIVSADATSSAAVTRSGTPVVGGTAAGNREQLPVPAVRAAAYRAQADFVLAATGVLRRADGTVLCDASLVATACADAGHAWVRDGASGWSLPGSVAPPAGTYFVEGDVAIPGNPGNAAAPAQITLIATGSISVTGAPVLAPDDGGLLLVTDGDLLISGAMRTAGGDVRMLVREQAQVAGLAILTGQLLIEDERQLGALVTASEIGGNATVTFSGAGGVREFVVTAWRRVDVR